MMAVYGLTGLKKPMIPLPEPYFDVRVSAFNFKIMGGKEKLTPEDPDLRQLVSIGVLTCGVTEADLCEMVFKSPYAYSPVAVDSPVRQS